MSKQLSLSVKIEVNEKDEKRCSINCDYLEKIRGTYHCTMLPIDEEVDTGDDDDIGYGFQRTEFCMENGK